MTGKPRAVPLEITESDVLTLLQRMHTRDGNGGSAEYAFLTHVRNDAGFSATRTIDAVAVSLWKSRGLTIEGFEVKVSRGDWLRELREPEKMDGVAHLVDRFTLVASDGVVADGELPEAWGHIVVAASGKTLRRVKQAPLLHGEVGATIPRGVLVAMLRAAGAKAVRSDLPGCATLAEHEAALARVCEEERQRWERLAENRERDYRVIADELHEIKAALGESWYGRDDRRRLVTLIRQVRAGERAEQVARSTLIRLREQAHAVARNLDAALAALPPSPPDADSAHAVSAAASAEGVPGES